MDGGNTGGGSGSIAPAASVSVVVPTYREVENVPDLVESVGAALSGRGFAWELLLVDDASDDGTEAAVARLAERFPIRIEVRRDAPRDLSLAVLDGIRLARYDRVCVMDADLSHPPERIADLVAALDEGCELAVGSRYAPGGRIEGAWSPYRRLNSWTATRLARPLVRCADPLSGFFATDRRRLPDRAELDPIGYKIALELMVRGGPRVREVPIAFRDRDRGASKMNWRQQFNYLRHLGRLYRFRFGAVFRAASFGLVGASGFVVDAGFYFGLQAVGSSHLLARFLSFWPAASWNWWLNRSFTFGDRPRAPRARQWTRFLMASLIGLTMNFGSYWFLTRSIEFFARERFLALVAGVVIGSAVNFAAATHYVYRRARAAGEPDARLRGSG